MPIEKPHSYPPLDPVEIYREQRAAHGRLEDSAYKALPAYATVVGGLWFFATTTLDKHPIVGVGVFLFAAVSAGAFALASRRHQHVGNNLLRHFDRWEGPLNTKPPPVRSPQTLTTMIGLLCVSATLSLLGAAYAGVLAVEPLVRISNEAKTVSLRVAHEP